MGVEVVKVVDMVAISLEENQILDSMSKMDKDSFLE